MNWSTIRPAIKSAIQTVTGLSTGGRVEWKGTKAAGIARQYPRIDLSLRTLQGDGNDETRTIVNDEGEYDVMVSGQRRMVLTVRIETDSHEDGAVSHVYASRLRARLNRASVMATLRAVGVALANIGPSTEIEFTYQDRVTSAIITDVFLNAVENDTDDTDGSGDVVERVQVRSEELIGENGEAATRQLDEEITSEDFPT